MGSLVLKSDITRASCFFFWLLLPNLFIKSIQRNVQCRIGHKIAIEVNYARKNADNDIGFPKMR